MGPQQQPASQSLQLNSISQPIRRRALNIAILALLYPSLAIANPDGAQIVNGQVGIDTSTPGVTTITNSPNAIINWQNFNIAQHELTQFIQQNGQSAVLNRIIGQNPSEILGQLVSNGKVFLINPNGIVFGAGAVIDTQGLVASSLNLSDQDFLSGNYHFIAGAKAGNLVNEGIIRAGRDGNIVLIAPQINNNGIIRTDNGSITLAAGQELTITSLDSPDIRFQVQAPADSVLNLGKLLTEGGAVNVFAGTIQHSGDIRADSVQVDRQGNVQLVAQQDITLAPDSTISANNSQGNAGSIHIDSQTGTTLVQGTLSAQSAAGQGGHIDVFGERVGLLDGARLDAGGANGGGQVLVGGDYQGKNAAVHNAKAAYVGNDATIKADAATQGNGGKVIVWSDNDTSIHGKLSAEGGSRGGNGGFIETSGKNVEIADTASISTAAANGAAGTWLIDPLDFTISAGSGAQTNSGIGATTLSNSLGRSNITIVTDASTAGNGDIFVNSAVSWSSNLLTLSAHRNIYVNADLNGSGKAQLLLQYGQATASGSLGGYSLNNGAQINLPAGYNFSTQAGYGGPITNYMVITDLGAPGSTTGADLQGMNGGRSINYVLGADIDASATSTWNSSEGFMPIGDSSNIFSGVFDGLGHSISNLTINRLSTDYVGLFGYLGSGAIIRNVGLINANVTGGNNVGALLGWNNGTVGNSYVTGTVSGSQKVGGLVGRSSGTINNSYASSTVGGLYYVGGLLGYGSSGSSVNNSYATGDVSSTNYTGGLIGYNKGAVGNSYASGTVGGNDYAGGLIGSNYGSVDYSYAIGGVTGSNYIGGLIGENGSGGSITNSYANGTASGNDDVGGLAGANSGSVSYSYATGNVSGNYETGGLVGVNNGSMTYTYATGSVTGSNEAGGLAGENYGSIDYSYATGRVACIERPSCGDGGGGLVGGNGSDGAPGTVTNSYWNTETTGWSTSVGSDNSYGKTSAEMKSMATFAGWNIANAGGSSAIWRIYEGNTGPLLRNFLTALTITANSASKVYDGTAYSGGNGVSYSLTNPALSGSLIYGGTAQGASNAGTYAIGLSGYFSNQKGYDITYVSGSLTITPALLSLTVNNATRVYGDANPGFSGTITGGGLVGGDTLDSIGLTFSTLANALSNVGTYAITSRIASGNYRFTGTDGQLTITPALLSLAVNNATRVYGDANPGFTGTVTGGGLVGGDTLDSIGLTFSTLANAQSNVGTYAITSRIASGNYTFTGTDGQLTITPLSNLAWVGGNGNWSSASNWANNVLPTTGNVLAVTIPTGANVIYDSSAGNTTLNSLNSSGHFQISGGNLNIGGLFSTADYTQYGGNLSAATFKVSNYFNQTGGQLSANDIVINASNTIAQSAAGNIKAVNLTANSGGDVTLSGTNLMSGVLDISAGGNIYSRTQGVSRINSLNAPNGKIDVENTGGFILGPSTVNPGTTVANAAGDITIKAKSPLTVNGAVKSAGGSVSLTASYGDVLSLNAPISAANGVILTGGTLIGSNADAYQQYFNTGSAVTNTLPNTTNDVIAVIVGTNQQKTSQSDATNTPSASNILTDPTSEKDKKLKQCVK